MVTSFVCVWPVLVIVFELRFPEKRLMDPSPALFSGGSLAASKAVCSLPRDQVPSISLVSILSSGRKADGRIGTQHG